MRILLVHNHYRQRGGEDAVVATEAELLRGAGHEVALYTAHNDSAQGMAALGLAAATLWNRRAFLEVGAFAREWRADVVHVHNTFPLLSPAVHHAARRSGAAVVQTLHNYRLRCPAATLFRANRGCEDCAPRAVPWPALVHGCYRQSRLASAAAVASLSLHRLLRTWSRQVDAFIALSEYCRRWFAEHGVPAERLHVKANAVWPDPGAADAKQGYGLFAGRLAPEKGIGALLEALAQLGGISFRIAGSGPLQAAASAAAIPGLQVLGECSPEQVLELLGGAAFLVVPSQWPEPFGRVVVEALARGTPVLAARIGALEELVEHGRTGRHFDPRDPSDLARQMVELVRQPQELHEMGVRARVEYESRFSAAVNLERLLEIYRIALDVRGQRPAARAGSAERPDTAPPAGASAL